MSHTTLEAHLFEKLFVFYREILLLYDFLDVYGTDYAVGLVGGSQENNRVPLIAILTNCHL